MRLRWILFISPHANSFCFLIVCILHRESLQRYHAQTQQVVIQQTDKIMDAQIQQTDKIMDTQIQQSDRILSGIDFSARKQEKKLCEMENSIVAKFEAKLETQCKELQKRFDYSMQQASNNSSISGVPGGVVSVGGQSLEVEQSMLTEDDRTLQPSPSLPETMLLRKQLDDATTDLATSKKNEQALVAENKSLLEQIQSMQSKRKKRPEDVVPAKSRISRNVSEKQRRAEEQSIALKVKGRLQKSAILESSNLPAPYKSKLRSRNK